MALKKIILFIILSILIFFVPAGSLLYWQAWLYLGVVFIPMLLVFLYLRNKDPELLEKRLQFKEKESEQKKIRKFGNAIFILTFIIPGFDYRFNLVQVPVILVLFSDLMVLMGYALFFLTIRENSFASRIVEIQRGQKVIDSGPYTFVRHPMYAAILIITIFSPTALGSFFALIPFPFIALFIKKRIMNEEEMLKKGLSGYSDYCVQTKYRLIPRIW